MFAQAAGAHERRNLQRITMALYRAERKLVAEMSDAQRVGRQIIGNALCWEDLLVNFAVGITPRHMLHEPRLCAQCTAKARDRKRLQRRQQLRLMALVHPPPPPAPHVIVLPIATIIVAVSYGNDLTQITHFKIKKSTPLRKIIPAYCSRWGLGPWQVRLMVAFNGHWLDSDDTAEKVGLVDGDIIAAFIENVHDSDLISACIKHWPALAEAPLCSEWPA